MNKRFANKLTKVLTSIVTFLFLSGVLYINNQFKLTSGTDKYETVSDITVVENSVVITNEDLEIFNALSPSDIQLSEKDELGREGTAYIYLTIDNLPQSKRESIGMVKPSGWKQKRYDDLIKDKYLYNRCHLLGFQYSGLNAEPKNLITCTRQANVAMIPYEDNLRELAEEGMNIKVFVRPVFDGNDLVAKYIDMYAVTEDNTVVTNVRINNIQDGIEIDYSDGNSRKK